MKTKALFIINPISGGKKKEGVPGLIEAHLDRNKFDHDVVFTEREHHAKEIARQAVIDGINLVVAVGGDGTVNEIASALVGTDTALGVIPCGSGNGLSRFLDIPMGVKEAIINLNHIRTEVIDSAEANGQPFFNMAGMGFDAHISEVFSHNKTRGFITYIRSSFKEVVSYQAQTYHIDIDGRHYERQAFMLSFANSSQYGNNAHVSPQASVQDGLLDVCIIKPFPLWRFIEMGIRMFTKTAEGSKYIEIVRGKHIKVKRNEPGPMHLDGEPRIAGTGIEVSIVPRSLKIVVGRNYKP